MAETLQLVMQPRITALGAKAKYWAGQKLLNSPFHPFYLKVTGKQTSPPTYEEFLTAEKQARPLELLNPPADLHGYELQLEPGVGASPFATRLLLDEALRTNATLVYADEDSFDTKTGRRHSPVFKPGPSPELAKHCDYIGRSFLHRPGLQPTKIAHVPHVLFHRTEPHTYRVTPQPLNPKSTGLVSIIICSRTPALLEACLNSLANLTSYQPYELVIVDHVSSVNPGMASLIARHSGKRIVWRDEFHFGRMCNTAVEASSGEYALFLNDDITPLNPDWLTRLVAQAERPEVGVAGALLYFPDGRIQHAGVLIGTPNGAGHPGRLTRGSPFWPWLEVTREVSAVTGACLLMRRSVFSETKGFDNVFPVNYNDVDLCLRVRQSGKLIMLETEARLVHHEATTRKPGIRYAERKLFLERWSRELHAGDPFYNPNLTDNEMLLPNPDRFSIARTSSKESYP